MANFGALSTHRAEGRTRQDYSTCVLLPALALAAVIQHYCSSITVVAVPDCVVLPALAFTAVAVQSFSVEQSLVFAQSPHYASSDTHLAEHAGTVHLHGASTWPVHAQT